MKDVRLFISELSASLMFTTAYMILIGRMVSEHFTLSLLEIGIGVSLIYFASVYISSYRYSADIFLFYSLYRCLREKSFRPLYINISGQIVGSCLGFGLYFLLHKYLLALSPFANFYDIATFKFEDIYLKYFVFGLFVFILTYIIAITRQSFDLQQLTGTVIIAFIVFIITGLTLPMHGVSVIACWQDILLSVYHGNLWPSDISYLNLLQFFAAIILVGGGIVFTYFRMPGIMDNKISMEAESFDTDYDI